ncbi:alpha/beta fold hydrolase [Alkalicaulis satelles]|uniref:Alpha/beta fold hydrolase n=1 Tax=Alkalicaulis satelles TaxID=2609175 RepID=A0A5M6ZNK4_9PROT|nr:alpha/beta fold hydrolase [Alkalicaulis satelles]KAA5805164.1 alpha/beta fold hydrolase [Alkalicaulis satelles]
MRSDKVSFEGALGETLSARLERPNGPPRGWALFAHCFSCSKDIFAAQRIARRLTRHGFAVLRFDFTGLGQSEGDFANTNFSSNVEDLVRAARWLQAEHAAPGLLIGHSLGGAAVIAAAAQMDFVKAVATIGAPADADHVRHHFTDKIADIERDGEAEVSLAGRPFRIKKQFLDDIEGRKLDDIAARLKAALMIVHAPLDELVSIDNATRLFVAAKHPKSFLSLDDADHLLTREDDAHHAADVIAAWALRYVEAGQWPDPPRPASGKAASVEETGLGGFHSWAAAGPHAFIVDEPEDVGGLDGGPHPNQLLCAALAACTTMTLRMYANRKNLELGRIRTDVTLERETDEESGETRNVFRRTLSVEGGAGDLEDKLVEIAGKCPVHRTLERASTITTGIKSPE